MPALPTLRRLSERGRAGRLPDREPRPFQAVDLYAFSRPAGTFTGDFYLAHRDRYGLTLALGDVAGKGLHAAVIMAMIQEELEQMVAADAGDRFDPAAAARQLNTFLLPVLPANRFATAVIARLRQDGSLVLASAGHGTSLIARRDGALEPITPTGPVLGVLEDADWSTVTTCLARTETLLLYSDGLVEARSKAGEEFGLSGVRRALAEATGGGRSGARQASEKILEAADRHAAGARQDDLTVVVVQRPVLTAGEISVPCGR